MKITEIKAYSINSPVTDWTYVKIENDKPGLQGWGEATLPTKTRGVLGAVGDLKKLPVAQCHADRGDQCLTVHVGWGIEDDKEVFRLVEAILAASPLSTPCWISL
jgi:galactonate dehydratase